MMHTIFSVFSKHFAIFIKTKNYILNKRPKNSHFKIINKKIYLDAASTKEIIIIT